MSRDTLVRLCLTWMCLTLYSKILKNGTPKINIKLNPIAGLSECIRVKEGISQASSSHKSSVLVFFGEKQKCACAQKKLITYCCETVNVFYRISLKI